jgi:hypothetical protein
LRPELHDTVMSTIKLVKSDAAKPDVAVKLCVDCKHVRYKTLSGGKFSRCARRELEEPDVSPITGRPIDVDKQDYCALARSAGWSTLGYCGPEARHFEPSGRRAGRRWWQLIET